MLAHGIFAKSSYLYRPFCFAFIGAMQDIYEEEHGTSSSITRHSAGTDNKKEKPSFSPNTEVYGSRYLSAKLDENGGNLSVGEKQLLVRKSVDLGAVSLYHCYRIQY